MDKLSNEVVCTTQNFAGSPQNILVVLNPIANNKKAENLVSWLILFLLNHMHLLN